MGAHTMASQGGGGGVGGRQGSTAYSIAFNGVETHMGEPLHSMNLEDLLRDVLPSDLGGAAASTAGHSQGHSIEHLVGASSSVIHGGRRKRLPGRRGRGERPPELGEVTLEDFLSSAGAAADGACGGGGGDWVQRNHHQQGITGIYVTRPLATAPPPARKRAPAPAPAAAPAEKTVERRQKRMIKNRESAARSRARRQAYTKELENKVSRLEEENERLRKEQQWEPLVHAVPQQEHKHQLCRTSSAPF